MVTKERPADRGRRHGRDQYLRAAAELRAARIERALNLRRVGAAVGLSPSEVSRIERGLVPATSIVRLAELHAVVGLDLSVRSYPGGQPIRDSAQLASLARLRAGLHRSWGWATEVPLPIVGDQRAWDAVTWLPSCRYGIEVETAPRDAQALARRLRLKLRDGAVDGILLVLPQSRQVRAFLAGGRDELGSLFAVPGARALELLRAGVDPGGNALIVLPRL
jgi:transcriptional regulator with XRE-family HTH domain